MSLKRWSQHADSGVERMARQIGGHSAARASLGRTCATSAISPEAMRTTKGLLVGDDKSTAASTSASGRRHPHRRIGI